MKNPFKKYPIPQTPEEWEFKIFMFNLKRKYHYIFETKYYKSQILACKMLKDIDFDEKK